VIAGLGVGTLLAISMAGFGLTVSALAPTNRLSLSLSLLFLLALFAPTQFPAGAQQGWLGELLQRLNPLTAGEHWIGRIVVDGRGWTQDVDWLLSPAIGALLLTVAALLVAPRLMSLRGGIRG
jgi:ABC-2 type transport system permease protein